MLGLSDERFWKQTFRTHRAIVRARYKALREQSVVLAFDICRIKGDAMAGKPKSLGQYLEQLLPDEERAALIEARFFDDLDRQIAAGQLSVQ